jgi:hypothetical protein
MSWIQVKNSGPRFHPLWQEALTFSVILVREISSDCCPCLCVHLPAFLTPNEQRPWNSEALHCLYQLIGWSIIHCCYETVATYYFISAVYVVRHHCSAHATTVWLLWSAALAVSASLIHLTPCRTILISTVASAYTLSKCSWMQVSFSFSNQEPLSPLVVSTTCQSLQF